MKRVAFTIIYNGLHHLKHNDFAARMVDMFDHWAIVEGAAKNNGSTAWCNRHEGRDNSTDGTIEFINELEKNHANVSVFRGLGKWNSKDDMCNHALKLLAHELGGEPAFLWEVDADEQWTTQGIIENETFLLDSGKTTGAVRWNHFVSHDLIAIGDWGGNLNTRLWIWNKPGTQVFTSHEPPVLSGTSKPVALPAKCNHYSYMFERDVYFKSQWYGGHEKVYSNWLKLQSPKEREQLQFPLHVSYLFGTGGWVGKSNAFIIPYKNTEDENKTIAQTTHQ